MTKALKLRQGEGSLVIPVDTIKIVQCERNQSRNLSCSVNGIVVDEGFDFVLEALGWEIITTAVHPL